MKRMIDLSLALALLPIALAIIGILLPFICLDTKASPIFRQKRVGRGQIEFSIYKLRTLRADTGDMPSHLLGASQITKLGRRLRQLKFDELPQIWNVITGSMSFVGPRPCLPSQHELIQERSRLDVFSLRPGITGIAQIAGVDMSEATTLARLDAQYLEPWLLRRDVSILWQTLTGKGRGDAALRGQHSVTDKQHSR